MMALSLRQPFLRAVLLWKPIENRRWNTNVRGEFLLHAAKGMTKQEWEDAIMFCDVVRGTRNSAEALPFESLERGGICGKARLVDVVRPRAELLLGGLESHYPPALRKDGSWRWHMSDQHGFILEDRQPLPFVPWTGELGFFEVPDDYAERAARGETGKKPRRVQA
jgi:hypothetical protein